MHRSRVPRVRPRPTREGRRTSSIPNWAILALALGLGYAAAWASGEPSVGMVAAIAAIALLEPVYILLAWACGWPKLRWSVLEHLLPSPL